MKKNLPLLILPLIVFLAVGLVVAGCGGGGESTTSSVVGATTTSAAGSTGSSETSTTVAGMTSTTAAGGIPNEIKVDMTGDEEVPPVQTDATGTFTLTLSLGGTGTGGGAAGSESTTSSSAATGTSGAGLLPPGLSMTYKLEVENITDANAAHIHLGEQGQNGDVVYPLFTGPQKSGSFTGVLAEGPLTESNLTGPFQGKTFADLVGAALAGQLYVNVHTVANPNGEIRGQLLINMGESGSTTTSAAGGAGATSTSGGATTTSGY